MLVVATAQGAMSRAKKRGRPRQPQRVGGNETLRRCNSRLRGDVLTRWFGKGQLPVSDTRFQQGGTSMIVSTRRFTSLLEGLRSVVWATSRMAPWAPSWEEKEGRWDSAEGDFGTDKIRKLPSQSLRSVCSFRKVD